MLWLLMGCFGDAARGVSVWKTGCGMRQAPLHEVFFGIFGKLRGARLCCGGLLRSRVLFCEAIHDHAVQRRAHALFVFHHCLHSTGRTSRFFTRQSERTRSYEHVDVHMYSAYIGLQCHAHLKLDYTSKQRRRSTRRQLYVCEVSQDIPYRLQSEVS